MNTREPVADVGRDIELCYQQTGDPADPPIVLIAGLGQQLHSWPDHFVHALAGRGYRVTRFDNRDAGRSTHMSFPPPNPVAMFRGGDPRRQYHLGDMARDSAAAPQQRARYQEPDWRRSMASATTCPSGPGLGSST
jgi:pimeloyl-ACP methyl ester carboxylesterase